MRPLLPDGNGHDSRQSRPRLIAKQDGRPEEDSGGHDATKLKCCRDSKDKKREERLGLRSCPDLHRYRAGGSKKGGQKGGAPRRGPPPRCCFGRPPAVLWWRPPHCC